jgi:hypothetical protein
MLLYNVIASRPVPRPGGIDYYPSVINTAPVGKEQADGIMTEQMGRGIRCRLEGVVRWVS